MASGPQSIPGARCSAVHRRCPAFFCPRARKRWKWMARRSRPPTATADNSPTCTSVASSPWPQQPLVQRAHSRGQRMGDTRVEVGRHRLPPRRQLLWRLRLEGRAVDPAVASAMGRVDGRPAPGGLIGAASPCGRARRLGRFVAVRELGRYQWLDGVRCAVRRPATPCGGRNAGASRCTRRSRPRTIRQPCQRS